MPPDAAVREAHTAGRGRARSGAANCASSTPRSASRDVRAAAGRLEAARSAGGRVRRATSACPPSPGELAAVKAGVARLPAGAGRALAGRRGVPGGRAGRGRGRGRNWPTAPERLAEAAEQPRRRRGRRRRPRRAMYEELLETAGAAVEELYRQLDEVRRDLERRDADEKAARGREQQALERPRQGRGRRGTRLRAEIEEAARVTGRRGRGVPVVRRHRAAGRRAARSRAPDVGPAVGRRPPPSCWPGP